MPITSPPTNYQLDRPGSSGIACGPHLSIRDPADMSRQLSCGTIGAICVRGIPTFEGYEISPNISVPLDKSMEGWFDSGDMGYMDSDGWVLVAVEIEDVAYLSFVCFFAVIYTLPVARRKLSIEVEK